jgi:hypothetical protein
VLLDMTITRQVEANPLRAAAVKSLLHGHKYF